MSKNTERYRTTYATAKTIRTGNIRKLLKYDMVTDQDAREALEDVLTDRAPDPEIDCMCDACEEEREWEVSE